MSNKYLRQRDVLLPEQTTDWPTVIVGAGGIGSWTALILAKLGLTELTVYDFDRVEEHNLPSQFYRRQDVGQPKVNSLAFNISFHGGENIQCRNERYDGVKTKILIIGVDSMEERMRLFRIHTRDVPFPEYVIDARMGLEQMEIYICRTPDEWANTFPDNLDHVDRDPCTARSICYNTAVIGGLVGSLVKKIIKGEKTPQNVIFDLYTYMIVT